MTLAGDETPDSIDRMLRLLAEQARHHAVLLTDCEGVVLWWSHGAERVFRMSRQQAIGMHLSSIFTPEDRQAGIDELERAIANSDAVSQDDRWHLRADGSRFWSSGAMVALRNEQGEVIGYGKILRDRTDMKEQLAVLGNKLDQAEWRNNAKDLAITKIAHELRNVFAGIETGLQLVFKHRETRDPSEMLDLMRQQLELLQQLTEDLLEVQRLHAGKVALTRRPVMIQSLLQALVDQFASRCKEKGVQVECLAPAIPVRVAGDAVRLHQVFANLLDNAIKYSNDGGRIWIKTTIEDQEAVIHVEDEGRGIPPEMLTDIFVLFTQLDSNSSNRGLGIGLALVHELVQLHGGSVQATSRGVGSGSEFTVRLPLAAGEWAQQDVDRNSAGAK